MKKTTIIFIMLTLFGWITKVQAQAHDLTPFTFPEGADPETLATAYAEDFATRTEYMLNGSVLHYAEILAGTSAINYATTTGNDDLFQDLDNKYSRFFDPDWELLPGGKSVSSMLMLASYNHTGEEKYLDLALPWAGRVNTTYPDHGDLAADRLYFNATIDARFFKVDGNTDRFTSMSNDIINRTDYLLEPNGLMRHKENNGTFHWGRANGWAISGIANGLLVLPEDYPTRENIMDLYVTIMTSIASYQTENGLWRQLVNLPPEVDDINPRTNLLETYVNFEETSCTAMFTYAMIKGVQMGWLDEATFRPVIEKAWLGLVSMINEDGELRFTCPPTSDHGTVEGYLRPIRSRFVGDYHAQAAFLWVAEAFIIFNEEANRLSIDDNNIEDNGFVMYPNPAQSEKVTIKIVKTSTSSKVSLYDITGKAISQYSQPDSDFEISTDNLKSGVYFVKLINESATITKKLIVK